MITLYQWPPTRKLPNGGVFCMKLESYLRYMKLEHKVVTTTSFAKSPKKTMPFVEIDGQFISDSKLIIDFLEAKSRKSIDEHLTPDQRSQSSAYIAMLENHLVPALIYFRWYPERGWAQFSRAVFSDAPALVRVLIGGRMRRGVLKSLYSNGISRHTEAEVTAIAKQDIDSIAQALGEKQYVFGDRVSLLDIVMFSVLGNILHGEIDMPLVPILRSHTNLVDHIERMMKLIYSRGIG